MTGTPVARPERRWILPALWIALTVAVVIAGRRLPWGDAAREVAGARLGWLAGAALAHLVILPLWALEWRLLVPRAFPFRYRSSLEIVALTASVLNSIPMLVGEMTAVALLVNRAGLTRGAALSVLAMDQLLVAFAKVAVLVAAAVAAPVPDWVRAGVASLGSLLAALLVTLLILAHRWEAIARRFESQSGRRWVRLATGLISWGGHLDALRSPRLTAQVAALALAKKALEVAATCAIQAAFGLEVNLALALLIVAALGLTTLVPIAPGNLGVYEATVFAIYRIAGIPPQVALGAAIMQHLAALVPSVLPGYFVLSVRQLSWLRQRAG